MKARSPSRSHSRGATLPIVLMLAAMMLVTASAWLQTSLVAARSTVATRERVQAFHAADGALLRCSGMLAAALPAMNSEPSRWRSKASFEGAAPLAVRPFDTWPYAYRAPQCLIEAWTHPPGTAEVSYLITARGFGATPDSETWLQLRIDVADDVSAQHWRRVVARPF
ncbi:MULTISPECIES: pilus assembly PilX N-terminal domain-containing protein [unclassified Caballeronia]|uniref:pilus assembly PilX family protein n=1 Tax=unclassified Caballeronia TaxID=2646786 RepID=UPI00285C3405|nr:MULTISPECIES: pilus assembly PilX N-terminal domain-containing protein [unclassified Caballeronia]MDR5820887.1 pilus assembly PilX N-terminal domain-containing protein [Caballeronia sp. LZ043]MDR5878985.1 pilus assembly PilX N-terminal domain-containing protein [Caballeronia sp. LZ032]